MFRWLVLLAGCGRIGFDATTGTDDGGTFDGGGWTDEVTLELANPATEQVVQAPILVRLDPSRIDYARAANDGRDLRFTAAGAQLAHEIERWDPSGTSIVWVRVPLLPASPARTTLVMHYGNPSATAVDGEAVWGTDHVGVYHFAGGANDATSTHLDAQLSGGTMPVTDLLGQALALDAEVPEYAVITNIGALDEVVTFSLWMRSISPSPEFEGGIVWPLESSVEDSPYLGLDADQLFFETVNGDGLNEGRTLDPHPVGEWVHLALVWHATRVETYVDGQPRVTITVPDGPLRPAMPMFFGADCTGCAPSTTAATNDFLDGVLDEVRLERVTRTAAWFAVQHASMRDTLIVW